MKAERDNLSYFSLSYLSLQTNELRSENAKNRFRIVNWMADYRICRLQSGTLKNDGFWHRCERIKVEKRFSRVSWLQQVEKLIFPFIRTVKRKYS